MYQAVVFCAGLYHFDAIRFAEFSTMSMRRRREECATTGEHGQERRKKRCGDRREREERERKEAERRKGRPRKKESDRPRGVDSALRRQATPHQVRTDSGPVPDRFRLSAARAPREKTAPLPLREEAVPCGVRVSASRRVRHRSDRRSARARPPRPAPERARTGNRGRSAARSPTVPCTGCRPSP